MKPYRPLILAAVLSLGVAGSAMAAPQTSAERADRLFERGKTDEAIAVLRAAVADDPKDVQALFGLVHAYLEQQKTDEALEVAEAAIRADPKGQGLLARAMVWTSRGDGARARADVDSVLSHGPYPGASFYRGTLRQAAGDKEGAVEDFRAALSDESLTATASSRLGYLLNELGRPDEALQAFDLAIKWDPAASDAYIGKAMVFLAQERFDDALSVSTAGTRADPNSPGLWLFQGWALSVLGRPKEALPAFNRALKLAPEMHEALQARGEAYEALHRFKEAVADYDRAILPDPTDPDHLVARGRVRAITRDRRAMSDFDAAVQIAPTSVDAVQTRADFKFENEDYAAALADYDKVVELAPDSIDGYFGRAEALLELQRPERALRDINKVLEIEPFSGALYLKGQIYGALNDHLQAVEALDAAIRMDPSNASAWAQRSIAKTELGDVAGAASDRSQALKLDPSLAEYL